MARREQDEELEDALGDVSDADSAYERAGSTGYVGLPGSGGSTGARGRGMSAAFARDTLRCWLRGWRRFMSIAVISLLGVAVLTGIYAGCRDMFRAADRFYDAQGLHDIQVMSTLGLTDDDVDALRGIEGVNTVQPERSQSVTVEVDGADKTVTINEIGVNGLDQPYVQDGRLPDKAGEIAVTKKFLMDSGHAIGDTLTVTPSERATSSGSGTGDESADSGTGEASNDADGKDTASADDTDTSTESAEQSPQFPTELTIVGEVIDPKDVSNPDGIGSEAFRQTLASDYAFFAPSDGVTGNIYTAISLTVDGSEQENSFGSDYDNLVRDVADRITDTVQTSRQKARRRQLVNAAQAKLDKAKADAQQRFDDAQDTIDKNRSDLVSARVEYDKNRAKLDTSESEIKDGEQQIADGRKQLDKSRQQIEDGRAQITASRKQLDDAAAQLADARKQLDAAQNQLDAKRKPIDQGIAQAKQGIEQATATIVAIDQVTQEIAALPTNDPGAGDASVVNDSDKQWDRIRKALAELGIDAPAKPTADAIADITAQLSARRAELQTQRTQLERQRDQLAAALESTIVPAQAKLDQQDTDLAAKERESAGARAQLESRSAEIETGANKITQLSAQLDEQEAKLKDGRKQLADGRKQLKTAADKLADGEKKLTEAQNKLDQSKQDAETEFAKQQRRIDDIAVARWYVQTRSAIGGFSAIKSDLSSIESIGRAFPVVFLLVAVLMSLTAMTRMVEEERGLIGTYVGLGYGSFAISMRYVLFAALACLIGGGLGLIAGFIGIPAFLLIVLQGLYMVPGVRFEYDWLYGSAGIALFVVGVVAATAVACAGELRQTPAELMRPKAPRAGSRVLLERVTPIWKRMKFLNKVTVRNLVRFKSRLIMTVGGVAGCTALIVCGLAISDTVDALPVTQYQDVYRYDLMVVADHNDVSTVLDRLRGDGAIDDSSRSFALARVENGEITTGMDETESVQIVTVPNGSAMDRIADLRSVSDGLPIRMDNFENGRANGVIVSQSAANALGVRAGDLITLKNGEAQRKQVRVVNVSRSVIGADVYVLAADYQKFFGGDDASADDSGDSGAASSYEATVVDGVKLNTVFARYDGSDDEQIAYAERLAKDAAVLSVASTAKLQRSFSFDLMGAVVALIVALAGGLALVVLFTLANTNVSERVREMATLKVLGFYDREVHRYVNREMMILTVIGVIVGLPVGRWVGGLLTAALAMPGMYFEVSVRWVSYAIAAGVTLVFALFVQLFTNPVLDRIDPAVSLKSVE